MLVPANVIDVRPVLSFKPAPAVFVTLDGKRCGARQTLMVFTAEGSCNTRGAASRNGAELSTDIRWRVDQHLTVGAVAAEFLFGPAIQQAQENVTILVLFGTVLDGPGYSATIPIQNIVLSPTSTS